MNMVAHASFNLMALAAVVVPLAAGPSTCERHRRGGRRTRW